MRPASEVAHDVCDEMEEYGPYFAVKVIEADRQAVRAAAEQAERERIVAWLRKEAPAALHDPRMVANAIEAGEHLK